MRNINRIFEAATNTNNINQKLFHNILSTQEPSFEILHFIFDRFSCTLFTLSHYFNITAANKWRSALKERSLKSKTLNTWDYTSIAD